MSNADEPVDWDLDAAFGEDYLHFYAPFVTDERSNDEAELIAELLGLPAGARILDLCCGTGRIALRLAANGYRVTGYERSELFLEHARRDASALGIDVEWIQGDVRELDLEGRFDGVVSWFTSFGYSDDPTERDVLRRMHRSLVPGGRLLLESLNLFQEVFDPSARSVKRIGSDVMLDERRYDPLTGREHFHRSVFRQDRPPREFDFSVRLFSLPELRGWLHATGFRNVEAFDSEAEPFDTDSDRMILVADRP